MTQPADGANGAARGGPLVGVRVLDLIDDGAAYGPKLLAGLGAEVIRVEPPAGSRHRRRPSFYRALDGRDGDTSLYFLHYNAGKKGITLDPTTERGRELLDRLLRQVDVVFDNGELTRLGLRPEALIERLPLVVVSVTPFGLRGPRTGWQGGDLVVQAISGMIGYFGYRDERPARFGPEQAHEMSGVAAALGALIALFGARRDGKGELVDIAQEQVCALVSLQMWNASIYHQFGFQRERIRREDGLRGVLYETCDGFVALGAYRRPEELLALLVDHDAAEDLPELWATLSQDEFTASPHVEDAVRRFIAGRTRAEVIEAAQAHGMLGLAVNDVADLLADPFLQSRAFFVDVEHPELAGTLTDTGAPFRFSATPSMAGRRPPLLGEHNAEVYGPLGIDADALAELRADGVV